MQHDGRVRPPWMTDSSRFLLVLDAGSVSDRGPLAQRVVDSPQQVRPARGQEVDILPSIRRSIAEEQVGGTVAVQIGRAEDRRIRHRARIVARQTRPDKRRREPAPGQIHPQGRLRGIARALDKQQIRQTVSGEVLHIHIRRRLKGRDHEDIARRRRQGPCLRIAPQAAERPVADTDPVASPAGRRRETHQIRHAVAVHVRKLRAGVRLAVGQFETLCGIEAGRQPIILHVPLAIRAHIK